MKLNVTPKILQNYNINMTVRHNGMEGIKFLASQAKSIYHFKSIKV
jgi:hypothetical protein